jgi:hypothetical protein
MLESLRQRLGAWGNKYVSLGGRIVLLNAVLNAIPIFYLSFIKIPMLVWKKVCCIKREFFWGRKGERGRISWVKWDTVCKPKKLGGLGVRDTVNISLLAKWRWKLLEDDMTMWKEVLKSKYGASVTGSVNLGEYCNPWFSSVWWKDICSIGTNLNTNWFTQGVVKCIGCGDETKFWCDNWVGQITLQERFPRLFSVSTQKDSFVAELKGTGAGSGNWNFVWRRRLFVWEENLVEDLIEVVNSMVLTEVADK